MKVHHLIATQYAMDKENVEITNKQAKKFKM